MKPISTLRAFLPSAVLAGFAITSLNADTVGFNQTAAGPWDYNTGGNWVGGTINGTWDSSLTLAEAQTVTFAAGSVLGHGWAFNYAGDVPLTLRSSGTADRTITLGGDVSVNPSSNQTVTIGSTTNNNKLNVNLGGVTRTFTVNDSKGLKFLNVISSGGLIKTGTGTLTLSGTNTYSGSTTLTQGILAANSSAALGDSSATNTLIFDGGTLQAGGGITSLATRGVTLTGNGTINTNGQAVSIAGIITDAGGLTKTGAGTLTLSGANTYTGATNVNEGTLSITGGYLSLTTPINIAAGATLTTNQNNSFSGGGAGQGGAWTIAGTITGTASNAQTMPASVTLDNGTMSGTTHATYGRFLVGGVGTTITANGANNLISAGNIGLNKLLTVNTPLATDAVSITGYIGASNLYGGGLTKSGSGTLTISGANIYTGATNVNGGTLTISAGHINNTSSVTIAGGNLNYNSSTALTKAPTFSGTGGTLSGTGTITPAAVITSENRQTAGSSVTTANPTAAIGKQTFSTSLDFQEGSIFEWNLTANTDSSEGARGTDYDAVNTASLLNTGAGAIFRVVLNGTQDFSESFWDTNRTWADIFKTANAGSNLSIASIFSAPVQYYNSVGSLAPTSQGSFTITGTTLNWWTAVPEPSSALAGLLLTAGLLRRRRNG
jgi:autotransporter-associated beta strand protein